MVSDRFVSSDALTQEEAAVPAQQRHDAQAHSVHRS